jgi:hypothetical protein
MVFPAKGVACKPEAAATATQHRPERDQEGDIGRKSRGGDAYQGGELAFLITDHHALSGVSCV